MKNWKNVNVYNKGFFRNLYSVYRPFEKITEIIEKEFELELESKQNSNETNEKNDKNEKNKSGNASPNKTKNGNQNVRKRRKKAKN